MTFAKPMLLPKYIPTTGVRRCFGCRKIYAAFTAAPHPEVCPGCQSEHTVVVETDRCEIPYSESIPRQTNFFDVPPPPRPNAWIVESRWKPKIAAELASGFPNVWERHSPRNITTERQAVNEVARLRRACPGKSFRVKAVSWHPTPLLP